MRVARTHTYTHDKELLFHHWVHEMLQIHTGRSSKNLSMLIIFTSFKLRIQVCSMPNSFCFTSHARVHPTCTVVCSGCTGLTWSVHFAGPEHRTFLMLSRLLSEAPAAPTQFEAECVCVLYAV